MKYEKSCGAVVFTRLDGEIHYVIIRSVSGEYGLPKGHMEPGEDEHTTALREIFEEVGLTPVLVDGFRQEIRYLFPNKPDVTKIAVYFLAEFSGQQFRIQQEEVAEARLMTCEEAHRILSFSETKSVLEKAHRFLANSSQ